MLSEISIHPLISFEHLSLYIQKHLGVVTTNSKNFAFREYLCRTLRNCCENFQRMAVVRHKEAIHSGHFMVSNFEAEAQDDEEDIAVPVSEDDLLKRLQILGDEKCSNIV